jgi:hypothetical protein
MPPTLIFCFVMVMDLILLSTLCAQLKVNPSNAFVLQIDQNLDYFFFWQKARNVHVAGNYEN